MVVPRKKYPILYRCGHCNNDQLTRRDLVNGVCPVCKFGWPQPRHWNGFQYC